MRAAVRHSYGTPDVLELSDLPTPEPRPDEVRVCVRAVAVNRGDWELLTGKPRFIAAMAGLYIRRAPQVPGPRRGPKFRILGYDIAGVVDAVGAHVTRFQVGDEVFGETSSGGFGGFAEYVCLPESARLVPKPPGLSWEVAAALPEGGSIALKAFRDLAPLRTGTRLLVNGAGGGAGTLALQLARRAGAQCTGVDSADKAALMREAGADRALDFREVDFASAGEHYDVILDLIATRSVMAARRALAPDGVYLIAGGDPLPTFQAMLGGPIYSRLGRGRIQFLMADDTLEGLTEVGRMAAEGEWSPIIDSVVPLDGLRDALWRIGRGEARGKLLVTL